MLRNRRAADGQLVGDLTDRARAFAQLLEDRPTCPVAQGVHWILVSHDLRKSKLTKPRSQVRRRGCLAKHFAGKDRSRGRGLRGEGVTPLAASEAGPPGAVRPASPC